MTAPISPDRANQIRLLSRRVVELSLDERAAFLDEACRDDPTLRRDLISLLDHADEFPRLLDPPTEEAIRQLLTVPGGGRRAPNRKIHLGQTVSHYEITERLGGGGMGVVYKALDSWLDRTVALKFLPPELTRDPEAKARFAHEAKAASALDHPNICTIYEVGETEEGQLFIAMAYYAGETIKAKIERGPLPVEEALNFSIQIAEALVRAHAASIVHRDVKPANVIVPDEGPVKLVDFGLAKVAGRTQLTQSGTTLGTVAYMSPEQARGDTVDERTDVWSLGVVLYEMLTGQQPFRGEYQQAVIYSILNEAPRPIRRINPALPLELERIVGRALENESQKRYASTSALLKDLRNYQSSLRPVETGAFNAGITGRSLREPRVALPAVGVLLLLVGASAWYFDHQAKIRWALQDALPELERIVDASWRDYTAAYALAQEAERYIPDDPRLQALMAQSSLHIDIDTEPPGADVYMKKYDEPESEWQYVGITPIDSLRVPVGIFRWRMEKVGYDPVLAAASTWDVSVVGDHLLVANDLTRELDEQGSIPESMVRVPGAETPQGAVGDFFIDRYEVTNADYKVFVDSGAYGNKAYWHHEFVKDGKVLTWEAAMAEFVDRTGRPGPSTWQAGDYPDGQADHPVAGVSWYEAAAYAEFAGKSLPTGTHWGMARGEYTSLIRWPQLGGFATFSPYSNFGGEGPVAAGHLPGITSYGASDMAGNVREWCWNETPEGRLIRGGAWNDNPYRFTEPAQAPPFDRSPKNGFRCARYPDPDRITEMVFGPTSFGRQKELPQIEPVTDAVFRTYKDQFAYDKTSLLPHIEARNETAEDWIHERISFTAAYGGERMIAHLFLPKNTPPPYQTVIYFPGSASLFRRSSDDLTGYYEFPVFLTFLIKNGRAVLFPVYKGTFERQDMAAVQVSHGADSYLYTEYLVKWVKDFSRSIDYLETRRDIDSRKLAFYGMSWGGRLGTIIPAVEDRLQVSILAPGVLLPRGRPEANQLTYISRVTIPTLMLNGRYDTIAGSESAARILFDLLGTPEEHKELKLYETDHIPPRDEYIKETLAWLDRYLGPAE